MRTYLFKTLSVFTPSGQKLNMCYKLIGSRQNIISDSSYRRVPKSNYVLQPKTVHHLTKAACAYQCFSSFTYVLMKQTLIPLPNQSFAISQKTAIVLHFQASFQSSQFRRNGSSTVYLECGFFFNLEQKSKSQFCTFLNHCHMSTLV